MRSTRSPTQSAAPTSRSRSSAWRRRRGAPVQRIGLSATQNPLEEIGRFLVGPGRKVTIVDAGARKKLDLRIEVPVESMGEPALGPGDPERDPLEPVAGGESTRSSIWPAIYPELLELVQAHNSTIVFVNNRRSAERVALRLNELAVARQEGSEAAQDAALRSRALTTARSRARSGPRSRSCSRRASCPASSPPARSSSGSTWEPSTWCCRSSRPSPSPAGCSASAAPDTASMRSRPGGSSPSSAATCSSAPSSRGACTKA